MQIIYRDQPPLTQPTPNSIFLAGPTPRSADVESWRPFALEILESDIFTPKFDGIVCVPEELNTAPTDYVAVCEWEYSCLSNCEYIAIWVPRNLKNMLALTTNIEFGYWLAKRPDAVRYGRPNDAPQTGYLDWLYHKLTGRTHDWYLSDLLNRIQTEIKGKESTNAKTEYTEAPDVKLIAEDLIPKYHQHLKDNNVRIEYVFVNKTPTKNGKEVWGTCRKVTGLNAFLANNEDGIDPFFCITISEPVWEVIPSDKRVILVDHELAHAGVLMKENDEGDEEAALTIVPHDVEEFECIIKRHGLWREELRKFVEEALKHKENE